MHEFIFSLSKKQYVLSTKLTKKVDLHLSNAIEKYWLLYCLLFFQQEEALEEIQKFEPPSKHNESSAF